MSPLKDEDLLIYYMTFYMPKRADRETSLDLSEEDLHDQVIC